MGTSRHNNGPYYVSGPMLRWSIGVLVTVGLAWGSIQIGQVMVLSKIDALDKRVARLEDGLMHAGFDTHGKRTK